jgi:hypothetical protein
MAGNGKLWQKGTGVNYVLVFQSRKINVSRLLEALKTRERSIPLG